MEPGSKHPQSSSQTAALTHLGNRQENDDRYLIRTFNDGRLLLAVADGMGGHAGGSRAAAEAIEALSHCGISEDQPLENLGIVIRKTSKKIQQMRLEAPELEGMGTTLTVALLATKLLFWAHVGDSRIYVLQKGRLSRVTVDQTLVQGLIEGGMITPDEAMSHPLRHIIDQCVGCPECIPDLGLREINSGDIVLLTTDGLHDALRDWKIELLVREAHCLEDAARTLVREALHGGGKDNITVVLARAG
jgi:PPM family protein phosphatase